jgi:hypothetical protein
MDALADDVHPGRARTLGESGRRNERRIGNGARFARQGSYVNWSIAVRLVGTERHGTLGTK